MRTNKSIEMIEMVANGLGDLLNDVVFIGGAVTSLYTDDPGALYVRPTKDVDCIVEIVERKEFSKLEKDLRARGFRHCLSKGAPICRWIYNDVLVDVMPSDEVILGFSNQWYKDGFSNVIKSILPDGTQILLLTLPYFIATKIEAFHGRSEMDFRISHDIEDIVIVLDGILSFNEFYDTDKKVKSYIAKQFRSFLEDRTFIESLSSHIDRGQSPGRTKRVMDFLHDFCSKI